MNDQLTLFLIQVYSIQQFDRRIEMLKIGLLILVGLGQVQIIQDTLGLEDLLRAQQIENQLLAREVEILEKHVLEIRNTVYWALGGVFTLAILFVGVNWFSMNKLYEKDKERLEDDIYDYIDDTYQVTIDHQIAAYYSIARNSFRTKDYNNSIFNLLNCLGLLQNAEENNMISDIMKLLSHSLERKPPEEETKELLVDLLSKVKAKFASHSSHIEDVVKRLT